MPVNKPPRAPLCFAVYQRHRVCPVHLAEVGATRRSAGVDASGRAGAAWPSPGVPSASASAIQRPQFVLRKARAAGAQQAGQVRGIPPRRTAGSRQPCLVEYRADRCERRAGAAHRRDLTQYRIGAPARPPGGAHRPPRRNCTSRSFRIF